MPATWLDQPANQLILLADQAQVPAGITEYRYNPDFLELSYPATVDAELDRIDILALQDADVTTSAKVQVTGFTTDQVYVYDVRLPEEPEQLLNVTATEEVDGTTTISFPDAWDAVDPPPGYWLSTLDEDALLAPAAIEVDQPSNWKSPDHTADYIAIVHKDLWDAPEDRAGIDDLLARRAAEGLRVAKVDVQDIYDEFNYGRLHPNAIRDFLSYAYDNWNDGGTPPEKPPKYVLLVGDGTVDPKGVVTTLKTLVPAFLINIDPFMVETAADNRFVTFDGPDDVLPEMTIGRISAQSAAEVANYVEKVAAYEDKTATPDGAWQNRVVYVADTNSNLDGSGAFHDLSDDVRFDWLPFYYESRTVYFKSSTSLDTGDEMKAAIKAEFDNSAVFLQWFGHASVYRWGGEAAMWTASGMPSLAANKKTPFVAAFSCLEGYFVNINRTDRRWQKSLCCSKAAAPSALCRPAGSTWGRR